MTTPILQNPGPESTPPTPEDVVWKGTPQRHSAYVDALLGLGLTLIIVGILESLLGSNYPASSFLRALPFIVALLLWGWHTVTRILMVSTTSYMLTTRRLEARSGVANKGTEEIELRRIQDLSVEEPLMLRLWGQGNIVIHAADDTAPSFTFRAVDDPQWLHDIIRSLMEQAKAKGGISEVAVLPSAAAATPSSLPK